MIRIREFIRLIAIYFKYIVYKKFYGMNIDKSSRISFGAKLDKTNPRGIHIAKNTYIASGAIVFSHDYCRSLYADTYIGEYCFIGANAIIMAGVKIGNHVIIGSGAIVTDDVPSNCIYAGNPAKLICEGIKTSRFGVIT